jgi:parvulin-like peptidyl-prolyl isomerase
MAAVTQRSPAHSARPAPPGGTPNPTAIAAVEGIPITQDQFDRLAKPYFEEIHAKANRELSPEETALLRKNVLEELVRERLWIAAARAQGIAIPEDSIDARMKQFSAFQVNGRPDEARFRAFKVSASSNYREVHSEIEQGLLLEAYRGWMVRRFAPTEAELQKAFQSRAREATIRYLWLTPETVSLEPEASSEAIRTYYASHPDEFQTPEEARVSYVRFAAAAPAGATDSVRAVADRLTLEGARALLISVRAGAPVEQAAKVQGGVNDSGWFRLGEAIRGLGRSELLAQALRGLKPGEWVTEPVKVGPYYVIARLTDRHPPRLRPLRDVVGQAKRHADGIIRDARLDSLARLEYERRPDLYRAPRLVATAVTRSLASYEDPRPLADRDIQKAIERIRRKAGVADTARAWTDSVLTSLPALLRAERRVDTALKAMRDVAERIRRGERPEELAARVGGEVSRIDLYKGQPPLNPSLVQGVFLDSLYSLSGGSVVGPRVAGDSVLVVKILSVDPAYLPPFEAARSRARSEVLLAKQQGDARQAEAYFDQHREDYRTPQRWVFDYVFFRKARPESVAVAPESLHAYYDAHPLEFTVPGQVRARHILISTRVPEGGKGKAAARAKAAAILKRVRAGEDFAALAREFSDDRGTASRGGDLGWLSKADVVPEFGNAAFALEQGQLSDLVESQFGFHIIRVEEKKPQRLRPFEDCRAEIQTVLGGDLADSTAVRAARAFAVAASKAGADFDQLARAQGGARQSPPLAARQELPGVGMIETIDRSIGSLPIGGVTALPVSLTTGYLVARLSRSVPPDLASYAEVADRVLRDSQTFLRRAVVDSIDVHLRASLRAGADLESLLVPLGGLRPTRPFSQGGPIPDLNRDPVAARDSAFLARIFSSKPGAALPPLSTADGPLYAVVDSLSTPPASEFAKARVGLREDLLDQRIEAWTARLRSRARVEIYRKDLRT